MNGSKKSIITPILIIAASRNGATSLVNMINNFPEVAKVEHKLHHGSHEAKLYGYYKFYGNVSNVDKYIDFLYHYSSEDYFQLAQGDIDYHLKNKKSDFFQFFFDLADRFCRETKNQFWMVKIDPAFFTDINTFKYFNQLLHSRYANVKYIRMQRELFPALQSLQYMEGKGYHKRRKWPFKYFYMLAYTQSWFKIYLLRNKILEKKDILHIDFNDFVTDKNKVKKKIRTYLKLPVEYHSDPNNGNYRVNTSFTKHSRKPISPFDKKIVTTYLKLLKIFPGLVFTFHSLYSFFKRGELNPMYRKLLKYKYFRNELSVELKKQGADGLLDTLKEINDGK